MLAVTMNAIYSKTPFMRVDEFKLYGDTEILTGRIEERMKHFGLGLTIFYRIK